MATPEQMARLEARRRFLGALQRDVAAAVGITVRNYRYWLTRGTTKANYNRVREALKTISKP